MRTNKGTGFDARRGKVKRDAEGRLIPGANWKKWPEQWPKGMITRKRKKIATSDEKGGPLASAAARAAITRHGIPCSFNLKKRRPGFVSLGVFWRTGP